MTRQEKKEFEERFWEFCQQKISIPYSVKPLSEEIMKKFEEVKKELNIPELEEFLLQ